MWPFVSRKAKRMVEDVLSNGSLHPVSKQSRCSGGLYVKTILEFHYDGYDLMIGTDSFGYTTGSRYFWLFNNRDRKWVWKTLLKSQGLYY